MSQMLGGNLSPAALSLPTLDLKVHMIRVTCNNCKEVLCGISPMGEVSCLYRRQS
jgi:hypothetical protein